MLFRLAIEDMEPNHWVAYALDLPGCFSSARSLLEAIDQAPESIAQYIEWLKKYTTISFDTKLPIEVELVEQFQSYESGETTGYIVNALFEDDKRPLGIWDIEVAMGLMEWSRNELLDLLQRVKIEQLAEEVEGEKFGSVMGILKHIAIAENWYYDRMGLGLERKQFPAEVFEMLAVVRENAKQQLVKLIGEKRIVRESGEEWSGRKIVRRMLWHECDHTRHIGQILGRA